MAPIYLDPELAARLTAAAAATGDFGRETEAYTADATDSVPAPDWQGWAFRFWGELGGIVVRLRELNP
jgi:hypothetical protein